jgi:peroxiredoxin
MGYWNSFLTAGKALCVVTCAASISACSGSARVGTTLALRERVPDVRLLGQARRPTSVAELRRGRPALISVWATWCDTCTNDLDSLNRLQQRLGEAVLVVGIAQGESYEHVTAFVDRAGIEYPQLIDEHFSFSDATGTRSLPAVLIADRDGLLLHRSGELDREALAALRRVIGP